MKGFNVEEGLLVQQAFQVCPWENFGQSLKSKANVKKYRTHDIIALVINSNHDNGLHR